MTPIDVTVVLLAAIQLRFDVRAEPVQNFSELLDFCFAVQSMLRGKHQDEELAKKLAVVILKKI